MGGVVQFMRYLCYLGCMQMQTKNVVVQVPLPKRLSFTNLSKPGLNKGASLQKSLTCSPFYLRKGFRHLVHTPFYYMILPSRLTSQDKKKAFDTVARTACGNKRGDNYILAGKTGI